MQAAWPQTGWECWGLAAGMRGQMARVRQPRTGRGTPCSRRSGRMALQRALARTAYAAAGAQARSKKLPCSSKPGAARKPLAHCRPWQQRRRDRWQQAPRNSDLRAFLPGMLSTCHQLGRASAGDRSQLAKASAHAAPNPRPPRPTRSPVPTSLTTAGAGLPAPRTSPVTTSIRYCACCGGRAAAAAADGALCCARRPTRPAALAALAAAAAEVAALRRLPWAAPP